MEISVIDQLTESQIVKLHQLYQNVWFTEGRGLQDVREMLIHTDFIFGFCLPGTEELIGFARVLSDRVYKAFVYDVIVEDSFQNKGLGNFIMNTIFNHPVLKKVSHIELYCPERVVPYYEKMGFKRRTSLLLRWNPDSQ